TTAGGGTEGIYLAVEAAGAGGIVAVEDPTSPRMVEALATLGLTPVPVPWDAQGPDPAALSAALAGGAGAFVFQPRAHLPTGRSVGEPRMGELAAVLRRHPGVRIVEDDGYGPLALAPARSLGAWLPERTL